MQAWQFVDVGTPLTKNDVSDPHPEAAEIIIQVKAAGLCHSDVGYLDGTLTPLLLFRPITLGHEIAGVVADVGANVTRFAIGDKVVVPAQIEGPGTSKNGGFAPLVAVLERLVIPLPDGVPWEQAAAATDAGLTSYHAALTQGHVTAGMKVGVIGFGGLGSLGAQAALAVGADVFVAELNEKAHAFAREVGVQHVAKEITEFTDEQLDVIIDYAGFGTTTAGAIEAIKPGGRIVQVGLGVSEGVIPLQTLTLKQVELVGSVTGTMDDCAAVLELVAEGKAASRITTISFDEIADGIERLKKGEVIGRLVAMF